MRNLAEARTSPSTEDLDQNGAAFHVLGAERWRVEPGRLGEFRHRAGLLRVGGVGCSERHCGAGKKEWN